MADFKGEPVVTRKIRNVEPASVSGQKDFFTNVALTTGDVVLFQYKDKDGTPHCVVATDGDALAIRT
jgi:hypothetical protein